MHFLRLWMPKILVLTVAESDKTMAQWLWDDGYPRRLIADMGGWFIKRDAIDLYFTTGRSVILKAAMFIGMGLQGRMHDD
jgi:hypothetical protein